MIARLQATITASLLTLAALWLAWAIDRGHPYWAITGVIMLLGGHAGFLGVEFCWMHLANAADPAPRARPMQLLRAWMAESIHAPRVFLWRQPFQTTRWPDRPSSCQLGGEARSRRGVILIHGFLCNRGLWNGWLRRLAADDVPVVALTLEPAFGSIDDYASIIGDAVVRLERTTGLAPVVVAHSMGGLAFRRWWADERTSTRIHHVITIGTPHRGTRLARLAVSRNGSQMREDSAWLQALAKRESPARARRMTCFYSHADNIVFPASTATIAGADNRHLPGTPHVAMVDHPAPWAELQRRLRT